MLHRVWAILVLLALNAGYISAQGLNTGATKDDWEEINFETGSSVLVDGYPSLLRLAELLAKNDGYKVKIEGHGDPNTSSRAAEKLGMARANMVKQFLEKYGARPSQSTATTAGNTSPKVGNGTKEGRFMNRRVNLTVTDPDGKNVSAAGVGDAIRNLNAATGGPAGMADPKCCEEVLKRLDKLDDILALLRGMKNENDTLRKDVDGLKAAMDQNREKADATATAIAALPKREDMADAASKATDDALARMANKKLSLLGLNAGADSHGRLTFTGKGRFFNPFNNNVALQAEGEYMYFRDRREGQFDIGLVNRYKSVQMGLFSSFKHIDMKEFQSGGTLGQAAATLDYVFGRGRVGLFGTRGFLNNAVVGHSLVGRNMMLESYLRIVDQVGASTSFGLWGSSYFEGNIGYLRTATASRPGFTGRIVQPVSSHIALAVEGNMNETLVSRENTGSVRVGVLFGSWMRPKQFGDAKTPIPVDIPRLRYEMLTRRIRTGNDAPVADAGPDQVNVQVGSITLDGSGSFDPENDPITYEWRQIAGPSVTINNPTAAQASFTAAEGQTYAFRLTVKDDKGAAGTARTTVTTRKAEQVRILRYQASSINTRSGDPVSLTWLVENADSVEISGVGSVDRAQGTTQVRPTQNTTYQLTAKNATSQATESITINVEAAPVRIITFNATPANIAAGQSSTLAWQTEGAETVTISGVGTVNPNGTTQVSPTQTTTYTLTARSRSGMEVTSQATVQVGATTGLPSVVRFTASPLDIDRGQNSTLSWQVENATTVSITSLGNVALTGQSQVSPTQTTQYTLTATNASGTVNSTVTVNVRGLPTITACVASPAEITTAGQSVALSFQTQNARVVTLNGLGVTSPTTVQPTQTTTYTLIAYNAQNVTAQCQVTVTLKPPTTGGPVANPGRSFDTLFRDITLDGGASTDSEGLPLTYRWRIVEKTAAILDPNSARTRVQLGEQYGPYIFELTVTNSKGVSSTSQITVNFISTTQR